MNKPLLLHKGDHVAVIAPSGRVNREACEAGIRILESWGLVVERGEGLYKYKGIFAGDDDTRLSDLQASLDDPEIKAIFCARGGYGLSRIIDRVDFSRFTAFPKWIVGYSDITLLHTWINMFCNTISVHGDMVTSYGAKSRSKENINTLKEILFGNPLDVKWSSAEGIEGSTEGIVAGGNLSLLCTINSTDLSDWLSNKILIIEDTGEYLYRLDRMIHSLRLSGVFRNIKGLIVGGLTNMSESDIPFGMKVPEIILDVMKEYNIPVAMGFPAGHQEHNIAFLLGARATFSNYKGMAGLVWD